MIRRPDDGPGKSSKAKIALKALIYSYILKVKLFYVLFLGVKTSLK